MGGDYLPYINPSNKTDGGHVCLFTILTALLEYTCCEFMLYIQYCLCHLIL